MHVGLAHRTARLDAARFDHAVHADVSVMDGFAAAFELRAGTLVERDGILGVDDLAVVIQVMPWAEDGGAVGVGLAGPLAGALDFGE